MAVRAVRAVATSVVAVVAAQVVPTGLEMPEPIQAHRVGMAVREMELQAGLVDQEARALLLQEATEAQVPN